MDVLERETFIIKLLQSSHFHSLCIDVINYNNELSVYLWRFVVILYYFFES